MKRIYRYIEKLNISCSLHFVIGVLLVLFCISLYDSCVFAGVQGQNYQASGLKVEVNAGFQGIIRLGRDTSVYVTVEACNSDFKGTAVVSFPDASGETVSYSKEIELDKAQTKCYVFTMPVINQWSRIAVNVNDQNKGTLFYQEYELNIQKDMESPYVGILSDSAENLTYLNQGTLVVHTMDINQLHYTMSDWNIFDVILVDDFDLHQLDVELFHNLMLWVDQGGTLVLGTGNSYQKTMSRLNEDGVISSEYCGAAQSPILLGMSSTDIKELKRTINRGDFAEDRINMTIANFRVEGSQILRRDTVPLVEVLSQERGKILLYHIQLGNKEFINHIISADISQMLAGQFGLQRQEMLDSLMYDSNVDGYCMNVVKESNNIEVPSILGYIITVIIYLLISGPLLYLLLYKMGRQKNIWWALPGTTAAFMGIVIVGGNGSRLKELQSSYFNLLYYNQDQIEEHSVFNLTVPYYDHFSVKFDPDTELKAINDDSYGYFVDTLKGLPAGVIQSCKREINESGAKNSIYLQDMTPYSSKYFTANKTYYTEGTYQSDLHFSVDGFQGSFTNELGYDLDASFLISSGSIVSLGRVPDGRKTMVHEGEGNPLTSCDYTMISDYVDSSLKTCEVDDNLSFEMSGAVNYFVQEFFRDDTSQSYVICFAQSNNQNSIVSEIRKQTKSIGIEMMILPVNIDYREGHREVVPFLDRKFRTIEGSYTLGDIYRYFTGTLIVEYQLPENEKIQSLYYSSFLNSEFDMTTYTGFTGSIYLYNRETKNYDLVFGPYQNEVKDLSDYLNTSNSLIVKYREKPNLMNYYMTIPYISYYKEAE